MVKITRECYLRIRNFDNSDTDNEVMALATISSETLVSEFEISLPVGTVEDDNFAGFDTDEKINVGELVRVQLQHKETSFL